ncbi:uncharacterized protein [Solanum lycopersicum]|uniref:uncharacterized protein n=1 Tax=Solanum lycopersicum TaxID=4081 RepID=UPI003749C077
MNEFCEILVKFTVANLKKLEKKSKLHGIAWRSKNPNTPLLTLSLSTRFFQFTPHLLDFFLFISLFLFYSKSPTTLVFPEAPTREAAATTREATASRSQQPAAARQQHSSSQPQTAAASRRRTCSSQQSASRRTCSSQPTAGQSAVSSPLS